MYLLPLPWQYGSEHEISRKLEHHINKPLKKWAIMWQNSTALGIAVEVPDFTCGTEFSHFRLCFTGSPALLKGPWLFTATWNCCCNLTKHTTVVPLLFRNSVSWWYVLYLLFLWPRWPALWYGRLSAKLRVLSHNLKLLPVSWALTWLACISWIFFNVLRIVLNM